MHTMRNLIILLLPAMLMPAAIGDVVPAEGDLWTFDQSTTGWNGITSPALARLQPHRPTYR